MKKTPKQRSIKADVKPFTTAQGNYTIKWTPEGEGASAKAHGHVFRVWYAHSLASFMIEVTSEKTKPARNHVGHEHVSLATARLRSRTMLELHEVCQLATHLFIAAKE